MRAARRQRRHLCCGTVVRERGGRRIGLVEERGYDGAAGCEVVRVRWWWRLLLAARPFGTVTALPAWRASKAWVKAGEADRAIVRAAYDAQHRCCGSRASSACVDCGRELPKGDPLRWGPPGC